MEEIKIYKVIGKVEPTEVFIEAFSGVFRT